MSNGGQHSDHKHTDPSANLITIFPISLLSSFQVGRRRVRQDPCPEAEGGQGSQGAQAQEVTQTDLFHLHLVEFLKYDNVQNLSFTST